MVSQLSYDEFHLMDEGTEAPGRKCPGWQLASCRSRDWTQNVDSIKAQRVPVSVLSAGDTREKSFLKQRKDKGGFRSQASSFLPSLSQIVWNQLTFLFVAYVPASSPALMRSLWWLIITCFLFLNISKAEPWPQESSPQTRSPGRLFWVDRLASPLVAMETREVCGGGGKPSGYIHWLRLRLGPFPSKLSDAWRAPLQHLRFCFPVL